MPRHTGAGVLGPMYGRVTGARIFTGIHRMVMDTVNPTGMSVARCQDPVTRILLSSITAIYMMTFLVVTETGRVVGLAGHLTMAAAGGKQEK